MSGSETIQDDFMFVLMLEIQYSRRRGTGSH